MKTVQTKPDCTLGFALGWKNPDGKFVFQLNQDIEFTPVTPESYIGGVDPYIIDEVGCTVGFNVNNKVIGKLSEITEEQARELVYGHPEDYEKSPEYGKSGLNKLALSVGIEEKDFGNYLVVKL
jgi:hypothetical protein